MYMTSRTAQYCLEGRMWPVGRRLEIPGLSELYIVVDLLCIFFICIPKVNGCEPQILGHS